MELNAILTKAMAAGASDVHLKHGVMPVLRIHGRLVPTDMKDPRLTGSQIADMAAQLMTPAHRQKFAETHEVDLGYGVPGLGRFRVNIFQQRGEVGMVIRTIPFEIKDLKSLNLPSVVEKITSYERGLILVTGITGSGKSTTLASMIDFINHHRTAHILTIEDPIEYLIRDRRSIINQRELGLDTQSFSSALKHALRQDPDVILIGEMRDQETIRTALLAAETGHLVFSTLHTSDARETITRILGAFEPHEQPQVRMQLASSLKAVVSQRLLPRVDKKGMVPAVEVMLVNTRIREMIEDATRTADITSAIAESVHSFEMQTFDQSLLSLVRQNLISFEEAKAAATHPDDFILRYKGVSGGDGEKWQSFDKTNHQLPDLPHEPNLDIHTIPSIRGEKTPHDQEPDEE